MRTTIRKTAIGSLTTAGAFMVGAIAFANPASAHMGVDTHGTTLSAGKGATIFLRPGHGCKGDATNTISVTIPDGVTGVKPQQKAGWITSTTPTSITWSGGSLPDDQFDDFGIKLTLPKLTAGQQSAPVFFKTVQVCDAEINVTKAGNNATIRGTLPTSAGQKVALFVDGIPLTKHDVVVDTHGNFTVKTAASKVKDGALVIAKIDGRIVGNSVSGQEAWIDVPVPGSTASPAMPAPSITITA